jgi:hypothetical protein
VGVGRAQLRNEVIRPASDGAFGGISPVLVRQGKLKINVRRA